MGGIRRHRSKQKQKKEGSSSWKNFDPTKGYSAIVRENSAFESFYKAQDGLCPPEEFDEMISSLRKDLPASFRVTGFRSQAFGVRDLIEGRDFYKDGRIYV